MSDILFKKKTKPVLEAKIEWVDLNGREFTSDLSVTTGDLIASQKVEKESYENQLKYIKEEFFKLKNDVDDGQVIEQYWDVVNYLKEVLGKKFPRNAK